VVQRAPPMERPPGGASGGETSGGAGQRPFGERSTTGGHRDAGNNSFTFGQPDPNHVQVCAMMPN